MATYGMTDKQFEAFLSSHLFSLNIAIEDAQKEGDFANLLKLKEEISNMLKKP